jgi:hypothetical protein
LGADREEESQSRQGRNKSSGLALCCGTVTDLERDLSAHLQQTGFVIAGEGSEARASDGGSHPLEVRVVKDIEGLDAQLDVNPLAYLRILR